MQSFRYSQNRGKHTSRYRQRKQGMTLVEVILALAIFAMAAITLSQSFISGMNIMLMLQAPSKTDWEQNFVLNEVLLAANEDTLEKGDKFMTFQSGEVEWKGEIEKTSIPDLFMLDATVEQLSSVNRNELPPTFRRFLFRPTWTTEQADRTEALEEFQKTLLDERSKMSHYP